MNARQYEHHLSLELRQVNDAVSCIFHSLMMHRTLAKFQYQSDTNFTLGSIGMKEVDCESIDLSYIRINSDELALRLDEDVQQFRYEIEEASCSGVSRRTPSIGSPTESAIPLVSTQIEMAFYKKIRRQSMPFGWMSGTAADEMSIWEQWRLCLHIFKVDSFDDLQRMRQSVADCVGDIVLSICSSVNQPFYVPKMPTRSQVNDVFDTKFSDCQPFLFQIKRQALPLVQPRNSFTQEAFKRLRDIF